MPVRIAVADLPIAAMNKQLGAFALSSMSRGIDGTGLGVVMRGIALCPLPAHCPLTISRNNVNITPHQD